MKSVSLVCCEAGMSGLVIFVVALLLVGSVLLCRTSYAIVVKCLSCVLVLISLSLFRKRRSCALCCDLLLCLCCLVR